MMQAPLVTYIKTNNSHAFDYILWATLCAGRPGREWAETHPTDSSSISSFLWGTNDLHLCIQWSCVLSLSYLMLLLFSAYYCGIYHFSARNKEKPILISFLCFLSVVCVILSLASFLVPSVISRSFYDISPVLLIGLVLKLLTWIFHTAALVTLMRSLKYRTSNLPMWLCLSSVKLLLAVLFYYKSLIMYQIHPEWYIELDKPFLNPALLYLTSFELFMLTLYITAVATSYAYPFFLKRYHLLYARNNIPERNLLLNTSDEDLTSLYGSTSEQQPPVATPPNEEGASFLSYLLFCWFNATTKRGSEGSLNTVEDLPHLPTKLRANYLLTRFNGFFKPKHSKTLLRNKLILLLAVIRTGGSRLYFAGILKFIADLNTFTGPILLNLIVNLIESAQSSSTIKMGYLYVALLLLSSLLGMLLNTHFQYFCDKTAIAIQSSLMASIFQKVLNLNSSRLSKFTKGQILDYMSADATRVSKVWNIHLAWSMPFMVGICLYLLHSQVGISFLAGLIFCLLVMAINQLLAVQLGRVFRKYMSCKDERIKMMSEILEGIRVIKLYSWENIFIRKVNTIRSRELRQLAWVKCLDAFCVFFWACTGIMMCVLTFITFALLGYELTAARVFTSVALFAILISPLNGFPLVLQWIVEAWVSLSRLVAFLAIEETQEDEYYSFNSAGTTVIDMRNATFSWEDGTNTEVTTHDRIQSPILPNLEFTVNSNEFLGIIGTVGAGKSSLFAAILMELHKIKGTIDYKHLSSGFGFVSQESWIQQGTIKSNILFGMPYKPNWYDAVIHACALNPDFESFPSADLTEVGENGCNLSGGQKARISLARACYQNKPCYLLDDPLSAVDNSVAQHIFIHCFLKLLGSKTRLLITHRVKFLQDVDRVAVFNQGQITLEGPPSEVLSRLPSIPDMLHGDTSDTENVHPKQMTNDKSKDSFIEKEEKCSGAVSVKIYWRYWRAIGHVYSLLILSTLFLMESSRRVTDWWLSYWTGHPSRNTTNFTRSDLLFNSPMKTNWNSDTSFYLGIYGGISLATCVFALFRAFTFAYGTYGASKRLHVKLLSRILHAKVLFFDKTPIGRILNRFSSDLYTVDFDLPFILNIFLAQIYSLLGILVITIYGVPYILIVILPMGLVYFLIQRYYRKTSRELKRIASVSMSPVYSHFTETLSGISTIKALRASERFFDDNIRKIDSSQQANFATQIAGGWFRIRIQTISTAVITGVGLAAVIQHHLNIPVSPGLIGLALSYAIVLTGVIGNVVEVFTQQEMLMVAVERVDEYTTEPPVEELAGDKSTAHSSVDRLVPSLNASTAPPIQFEGVTLCYREGTPPALNGVTFRVESGEKLGVVGRTGAGKSSLFRVLFRLVEIASGSIYINEQDISQLTLTSLRSRIAAIPQDPFLFSGSVRDNLCPDTDRYSDSELWSALENTYLINAVEKLGGLNADVGVGGVKFSIGQKQLLCLARAILVCPTILCIDEATANIDPETDQLIQEVIMAKFCNSTVITIAHRIETVISYDRILVMDQGRVKKHDTPSNLLNDPDAKLYFCV